MRALGTSRPRHDQSTEGADIDLGIYACTISRTMT